MKQTLFKINSLLIIASLLAITMAVATVFIGNEPEPLLACGVIDAYPNDDSSQPQDSTSEMISSGEVLFKENCKPCHAVHTQEVGPALYGVTNRRTKKWIRQFIRNNEVLVQRKDTAAINLIKKFGYSPHVHFESMTNKEIEDIMQYINTRSNSQPEIISCY